MEKKLTVYALTGGATVLPSERAEAAIKYANPHDITIGVISSCELDFDPTYRLLKNVFWEAITSGVPVKQTPIYG